ncbi:transcriptional repressor AgaR [Iodobacter fluviatilis]|uniref:DeoR family transcriptional regulator n=1 Tax=Iodobacter fluviatilis TaxID=537 RepID=A0A7G3G4R8_9NEIS|nr:transcriptional repressor AgaR [Iodobacter fluviatilis]QBC42247.1 DeoR family transcriptional regulator [Iodobacter fluviatilis]
MSDKKIPVKRMQTRHEKIVDLLRKYASCNVSVLANELGVSAVTIRHDLDELEKSGCISRSYGRATLSHNFSFELEFREKENIRSESKQLIAKKAAELVEDGDSIIVDSGSTVALLARYIASNKKITLMTNALNLASELVADTRFTVMMTGGTLRADSYSLCGPEAEQAVRLHHFNKLFIGADGIDFLAGVSTTNAQDAQLNRAMLAACDQIILLADSSKFGKRSFCVICKMPQVDILVTDNGISDEYRQALIKIGVTVIVAE